MSPNETGLHNVGHGSQLAAASGALGGIVFVQFDAGRVVVMDSANLTPAPASPVSTNRRVGGVLLIWPHPTM